MSTFSTRDLLNADRWSSLFFTTYALSLSFFEAVVLDAIVRGNIESSLILADVAGVRSAMSELGAQGVGRSYDVEPVAVTNGCFHAKLLSVTSKTDAHLVIGSGNLTFGGWGSNLECVEHLHPSFAPDTFLDTAGFLRSIASSSRIKYAASEQSFELADNLESRVKNLARTGSIRVIHNVGISIIDQVVAFADELGGATQLIAASPFFDGFAIKRLCDQLGITHAHVHVHGGGTVIGSAGTNWPSAGAQAKTVPVAVTFLEEESSRSLHGKLYEVCCRHGRLLISGSSNATLAGLDADRNVELCVVRLQREALSGWAFTSALAPARTTESGPEDEEDKESSVAVLRATLGGRELHGRVISEFTPGLAQLFRKTLLRWTKLGEVEVSSGGEFNFKVGDSWEYSGTGQFLIRLENAFGQAAQGFVALPELREIARRLGANSQNFFSLLQSKETAADVAAIMDFIRLHPEWLPKRELNGGGGGSKPQLDEPQMVDIDVLTSQSSRRTLLPPAGSTAWSTEVRFMQDVFEAFQQRRGPIDSTATHRERDEDDGEDDADSTEESEVAAKDTARALQSFDRLLDQLIERDDEHRQSFRALQIAQYVCERLEVETFQVHGYVDRILGSFTSKSVTDDNRQTVLALVLLWSIQITGELSQKATQLRRQALRLCNWFPETAPSLDLVSGFANRFVSDVDATTLWHAAETEKTIQEEMRTFWTVAPETLEPSTFPKLSSLVEWNVLRDGWSPRIIRMPAYSEHCPHCWTALSGVESARLRNVGVATCPRGKVLLCEEY
jgi:hypothetical protein